jgi:hypothetical protein
MKDYWYEDPFMFTMSQRLVFVIEEHGVFCEVYVQGEEAISITEIFFLRCTNLWYLNEVAETFYFSKYLLSVKVFTNLTSKDNKRATPSWGLIYCSLSFCYKSFTE